MLCDTMQLTEKRLRNWWASILHHPEGAFARHENLFSCGGDSLAVLRLAWTAGMGKTLLSTLFAKDPSLGRRH